MAAKRYHDDELDLLTEEERAGLLEEEAEEALRQQDDSDAESSEPPASDAAASAKADAAHAQTAATEAADDKPATETPLAEEEAEKKQPDEASAEKKAAAADVTGETSSNEEAPQPAAQVAPPAPAIPNWRVPDDAQHRLDDIALRRKKLAESFDDGDLTGRELVEETQKLDSEERNLRDTMLKASLAREMAVAHWYQVVVPGFLRLHPAYKEGSLLYQALDLQVCKLQEESDNPFDPTLLERAHAEVQKSAQALVQEADAGKGAPKPAPKAGSPTLPPTLAHVPASDITEADQGGEFAYLDRLAETDQLKFEAALAKLSDAERDRYLAS